MRLLLDSHAYVWFVTGNPRCSPKARKAIESSGRLTHVSAATAWEMATKVRLGKWPEADYASRNIDHIISSQDLTPLPISVEHGRVAGELLAAHKDPFDRILAAQAQVEDLVLVTADPAFRQFDVRILW